METEFWTTLLKVEPRSEKAQALIANCTHVTGPYWIMEGDTDYLRAEGIRFDVIAEGAVGCLGGLSESELIQVCSDSYGVDLKPRSAAK